MFQSPLLLSPSYPITLQPNYRPTHKLSGSIAASLRLRQLPRGSATISTRQNLYPISSLYNVNATTHRATRRLFSTDKNSNKNTTTTNNNNHQNDQSSSPTPTEPKNRIESLRTEASKASKAVRQRVEEVEERLHKVWHDVAAVSTGDQLTVVAIALLLMGLVAAPYVISQMKASNRTYDGMADTDDPVDDFTQLALEEWDNPSSERVNTLEKLLSDLVQSKALQQAAQHFVLQIIQAPEVKQALQRLLMSLWKDLVEDPETIKQVINLLAVAIQDPAVKQAALQLVLDIVAEDQVQAALVAAVQKLGDDPQVQKALQILLANTAHNTLNDAEVLDHSMEFATDVLGDDVVQQSAGEALRNTVRHAFRPAASMGLTATGVAFLLFGLLALGYARSSEHEARLLDSAARSLQTNAAYGLQRLLTWPARAVGRVWHWLGQCCMDLTGSVASTIGNMSRQVGSWVARGFSQTSASLWMALGQSWQQMARATLGGLGSVWGRSTRSMASLVHGALKCIQNAWEASNLALLTWSITVVGWGRQLNSRFLSWWPRLGQSLWLGMQNAWRRFLDNVMGYA